MASKQQKSHIGGGLYKTYVFKNKDPIIFEVEALMKSRGVGTGFVETKSGVRASTLRNWFTGPTRRPQYATVQAVVKCMGASLKIVKDKP